MVFIEEYKAALALNNRGVCLLELQSYRAAVDTFNKAFVLFKTYAALTKQCDSCENMDMVTTTTTTSSTGRFGSKKINEILNETSLKLSEAKKVSSSSLTTGSSTISKSLDDGETSSSSYQAKNCVASNLKVIVVVDDKDINRGFVEASHSSLIDRDIYAIRMDDMDGHCDPDDACFQFELSIILFNLATASYCYASTLFPISEPTNIERKSSKNSNDIIVRKLLKRAKILYNFVLTILDIDDDDNDDEEKCDCTTNWIESSRYMLLSMMSYQCLLQISNSDNSSTDERRQYYYSLGDYQLRLLDHDLIRYSTYQEENTIITSAAAA